MKKGTKTEGEIRESSQTRKPAVAGQFYPGSKQELNLLVDEYLNNVKPPKLNENIRALIVPHAGYEYSGQVAAFAYKAVGFSTSSRPIKTVVLIGNSHQEYFDGVSVWNSGFFRTPLGDVEVDADFANKLINSNPKIVFRKSAHLGEHTLEVQLPFLQKVLSDFRIVPIILGNKGGIDVLISALKDLIDEKTLVIASSDLSHYPNYKDAQYSDHKVIEAILSGKRKNLRKTISDLEKQGIDNLQTCACGAGAIEVIMELMRGTAIKLLKYANSGDITGDHSQVVGYASIVFYG